MLILKPYILAFWLSMLPVTELRATVPWIIFTYNDQWLSLVITAIIGNIIPAILLLWGLSYVDKLLIDRMNILAKVYNKVIQRTRRKTLTKMNKYGYLALLLFVAIPFPGTGVWTGSIGAWLFGLPKKQSLIVISLGAVLAGIIMTLVSKGIFLNLNI
ncbi:MAG: COG2426 family protein [Candidatus Komeilibacteria bacterium]